MKYGVIGEHLKHSFSKEIHAKIADYEYIIKEIEPEKLEAFMKEKDFLGINVTIPYKEKVIPYLDFISDNAKKIGAVNTIVNRNGKLYGYNTDYMGLRALILRNKIEIKDKKVLILGGGGTSKTARVVLSDMGAREIIRVGRAHEEPDVTYEDVYRLHSDAEFILNTTPVGMYPGNDGRIIDVSRFENLEGLIDVVYNPLRTNIVLDAKENGIKAESGLYMLSSQAVFASEIFLDTKYDKSVEMETFNKVFKEKENIVLTGMPSSGKTTVGMYIASNIGREFVDTDDLIVEKIKMPIAEYFKQYGEESFRNVETEVIEEVSKRNGLVIATGGGAILRDINVRRLKQNGTIYFLNRTLDLLIPTDSRPLSSDRDALKKRYEERYPKYIKTADVVVPANGMVRQVGEIIIGDFCK